MHWTLLFPATLIIWLFSHVSQVSSIPRSHFAEKFGIGERDLSKYVFAHFMVSYTDTLRYFNSKTFSYSAKIQPLVGRHRTRLHCR